MGEQNNWTQIIFNEHIPYSSVFTFKLKVVRSSPATNIMFGIMDYQKQKDARTSYSSANAIVYFHLNGKGYKIVVGTQT